MRHLLQRHQFPIEAHFNHVLALTYALSPETLKPLLGPGLELDLYKGKAMVAIAMVKTQSLRPRYSPRFLGAKFFLTGYRIFVKFTDRTGRTRRGLRILRSDTNHLLMKWFGNLLTHYKYHKANVSFNHIDGRALEFRIDTEDQQADLHVCADLSTDAAAVPVGSPFESLADARKFAGPLPFTFDYEPQTHSIVMVQGLRSGWTPRPVNVRVHTNTFFDHQPFDSSKAVLAGAFHISDVDYQWGRGVVVPLQDESFGNFRGFRGGAAGDGGIGDE